MVSKIVGVYLYLYLYFFLYLYPYFVFGIWYLDLYFSVFVSIFGIWYLKKKLHRLVDAKAFKDTLSQSPGEAQ